MAHGLSVCAVVRSACVCSRWGCGCAYGCAETCVFSWRPLLCRSGLCRSGLRGVGQKRGGVSAKVENVINYK